MTGKSKLVYVMQDRVLCLALVVLHVNPSCVFIVVCRQVLLYLITDRTLLDRVTLIGIYQNTQKYMKETRPVTKVLHLRLLKTFNSTHF